MSDLARHLGALAQMPWIVTCYPEVLFWLLMRQGLFDFDQARITERGIQHLTRWGFDPMGSRDQFTPWQEWAQPKRRRGGRKKKRGVESREPDGR
jgi:hypothetical protein